MIGCEAISVLSKRELEVVRCAGEGLNNKDIAEKLSLSEHTVKNYLFRAFEKIGVSSRVELLFYLSKQGKKTGGEKQHTQELLHHASVADFQKPAEEGFATAQFALGLAHLHGAGTTKDENSAYYWLALAQRNAEHILLKGREALQKLRSSLTAEQIRELENSIAASDTGAAISRVTCESVNNTAQDRDSRMAS
jgi:DNA-binding CsgD family transcriptional regulator